MSKPLLVFDLGHATVVRVVHIGAVMERGANATVPFQYEFTSRGHLSRYQVNKRMSRWFMNVLRRAVHQEDARRYAACVDRDRRWEQRHLRLDIARPE